MEEEHEVSPRPISGEEYLRQLGEEYQFLKDKVLPRLSDEAFEYQKDLARKRSVGLESFLADFAIAGEERRRNIERWTEGKELPEAKKEQIEAVHKALPAFVSVSPEAMGAMKVELARSYRTDIAAEDIINEVVARLPRKIDAYRYHQGYAEDEIEIEGLGKIKARMYETRDGIFRSISSVESDDFRIENCRTSGVTYLNRLNDISKPSDVIIKPLKLEINLYSDDSGIFVGKDGKRYTNARWQTHFGRGYSSDVERDELYRTYSGPNPAVPREGYTNKGWKKDKTKLSWKKIEDGAIVWLVDNVLNPLKQVPKPKEQEASPPEEEPFPKEKIGPLYTFVEMKDMERIFRIKGDPKKAYPHERKAVRPGRRLFSLDLPIGEGIPEAAYDGFIWCGVGKIDEKTDIDKLNIAQNTRRKDRLLGRNEGIAVIKPKTATDIYVVDWQEWDNYRERTFTKKHWSVGKTMVPITEYKGDYQKPVVLIGRSLELDEVEQLYFPPEEKIDLGGIEATVV